MSAIIIPSLDIEKLGQPTLYLDDEAVFDDMSKTICICIAFTIVDKIIRENGK